MDRGPNALGHLSLFKSVKAIDPLDSHCDPKTKIKYSSPTKDVQETVVHKVSHNMVSHISGTGARCWAILSIRIHYVYLLRSLLLSAALHKGLKQNL